MLIEEIRNIQSSKKDLRNFGLTVGSAMIIFGGILIWLQKTNYLLFLIVGFGLFLCGVFVPGILKPVQRVWMKFALILGWLMTG